MTLAERLDAVKGGERGFDDKLTAMLPARRYADGEGDSAIRWAGQAAAIGNQAAWVANLLPVIEPDSLQCVEAVWKLIYECRTMADDLAGELMARFDELRQS